MKTRLLLLFLLLPLGLGVAQNAPAPRRGHGRGNTPAPGSTTVQAPGRQGVDSAAAGQATAGQTTAGQGGKQQDFVDENGDGINDCCATDGRQGAGKGRKGVRRCDTFTDADGDGINDNRCNGVGPRMRRRQAGAGK
jgi:hypothetical protein